MSVFMCDGKRGYGGHIQLKYLDTSYMDIICVLLCRTCNGNFMWETGWQLVTIIDFEITKYLVCVFSPLLLLRSSERKQI